MPVVNQTTERPVGARRPAAAPSYAAAALRVFDLSMVEMLWSRRTVFLGLLVGGPVLIALIARVLTLFDMPALRVNGAPVDGRLMFGLIVGTLYIRFIVPLLGVFYGTALIADEVDDKTITYLFTRPIPRGSVLLGKYLAFLACTVLIVLPSVMIVFFLLVPIGGGSIAAAFPDLLKDLGLLAVGLAAYGAVFAFIGAQVPRPLLVGLLFVFGWETVVQALPGYLKRFSVAYYLQSLVPHALPAEGAVDVIQSFFRESLSPVVALGTLAGIVVVCIWLAVRAVSRREYVLEQ